MSREGFLIDEDGKTRFVYYDEVDPEVLPQLIERPVGGFCYEGGSFTRLPLAKSPYYLKDFLPKQGKMIIYGQPKSGKSFLCLQLARSIVNELPFLGMPTHSGRVLYLQFELGMEILQHRMKMTGQDYSGVYVGTTFGMKLDTASGKDMLKKAVEEVQPNVVILDPLYKVLKGDEKEAHDMLVVLDFLDDLIDAWRTELGLSFVIMHHPGKDLSRGGRGSSVLEDWVDSYVEMTKISRREQVHRSKLKAKLMRHAELPPDPIEIEMEKFEFVVVDGKPTIRNRVLEIITCNSSNGVVTTPADLEQSEVGGRKSVYDALKSLTKEGTIKKVKMGEYMLATGRK